jgi:hypothetical protein
MQRVLYVIQFPAMAPWRGSLLRAAAIWMEWLVLDALRPMPCTALLRVFIKEDSAVEEQPLGV